MLTGDIPPISDETFSIIDQGFQFIAMPTTRSCLGYLAENDILVPHLLLAKGLVSSAVGTLVRNQSARYWLHLVVQPVAHYVAIQYLGYIDRGYRNSSHIHWLVISQTRLYGRCHSKDIRTTRHPGTDRCAVYIGSYGALQLGQLDGNSLKYSLLNGIAAVLVLISLYKNFNLASACIQVVWISVSIAGIYRHMQCEVSSKNIQTCGSTKRQKTDRIQPRTKNDQPGTTQSHYQ